MFPLDTLGIVKFTGIVDRLVRNAATHAALPLILDPFC